MHDLIRFLNRPQCLIILKLIPASTAMQDKLIKPTIQLHISRTQGPHTPRKTFSDSRPHVIIRNHSLHTRYLLRNHNHHLLPLAVQIIRMVRAHLSYQTLLRIPIIPTHIPVRLRLL